MTLTPIFAPYSQTYSQREPYITAAEYAAAPTGISLSTLQPGGTAQQQADALQSAIARGSAWVDQICHQILAATLEVVTGQYQVQNGLVMVTMKQSPVIAVYAMSLGLSPVTMTPLLTNPGIDITSKIVKIPLPGSLYGNNPVRASVTYVAGFANNLLTTPVIAAVGTLPLDGVLGITPGMTLTINDPGQTEIVTVLSVGTTTIALVSPTKFAHASGVNVSALPAEVKQAAILLTTATIKTRASEAIVLQSSRSTPTMRQPLAAGKQTEENDARMLLNDHIRVA